MIFHVFYVNVSTQPNGLEIYLFTYKTFQNNIWAEYVKDWMCLRGRQLNMFICCQLVKGAEYVTYKHNIVVDSLSPSVSDLTINSVDQWEYSPFCKDRCVVLSVCHWKNYVNIAYIYFQTSHAAQLMNLSLLSAMYELSVHTCKY